MADEDRDTPPAFGVEGLERNSGYKPMFEDAASPDELTVEDAASLQHDGAEPEPVARRYIDRDGNPVPENQTLTLERAAADLSAMHQAEVDQEADALDELLLKELDPEGEALRAQQEQQHEAEQKQQDAPQPQSAATDLDAALSNPQIRQAIETQLASADAARDSYVQGLNAAMVIAEHTFASQFPEFANTPPEQHMAILQNIAHHNPARAAAIQNAVLNSGRLVEAAKAERQAAAERESASFKTYAAEQDAVFDKAMPNLTVEQKQEIAKAIFDGFAEYGIGFAQLQEMYSRDRTIRHAGFQRMIYDAAMYRVMQQSAKAAKSKPLPPVQRPGTSAARSNSGQQKIDGLAAAFKREPSLENATALYAARSARN